MEEELHHLYHHENDNWQWADGIIIKRNYDNFLKQRIKHVFKLLAKFKNIKYRSILEDGQVFQYILNVDLKYETAQTYLQKFEEDCYKLLHLVATESGKKDFPVEMLFRTIGSDDVEYLENLLVFLKNMGYLRIPNSLIPTGIEVTRLYDENINEKDPNSHDYVVYQEFLENAKLRELRLLVLQSAALLYQQHPRNSKILDQFIKQYFICKDTGDIINLLDEFIGAFPKGQEILKIVKEEALIEKEEQLNLSQRTVYDFSIQQNLNVIAEETVNLQDYAKEECRLYYVALTRAKDRLVWLRAKRATQFSQSQSYSLSKNQRSRLGYPIKEGIGKFLISYSARQPANFDDYIQQKVKIGSSITLKKDASKK